MCELFASLRHSTRRALAALTLACAMVKPALADDFTNWESPHVHPLELTPSGDRLLAVNTANNTLEVFAVSDRGLAHQHSIPTGLNPVSVRARNDNEAWVVNHISDSVSVVDLDAAVVTHTLNTDDEPADVVFAGNSRAFVSCSQANTLQVFSTINPLQAPARIAINGEDPRALAVSPDGQTVYAAIFESGNATTILAGGRGSGDPGNVVDDPRGPYRGQNPPPNNGNQFSPAINRANGTPPRVGMIVKKSSDGRWRDDNDRDWSRFVSGDLSRASGRVNGWDLPDRDVAIVDANTLAVTYQHGLMNVLMAGAVNPATGELAVVGTDAINHVRYEPNLRSRFVSVRFARFRPGQTPLNKDLNAHLPDAATTLPAAQRAASLGDPRGIAWSRDGSTAFIAGMGSNNVLFVDSAGDRLGSNAVVAVGEGPTGIVHNPRGNQLYVLNHFEGTISTIDVSRRSEVSKITFFDPTPESIKRGRPLLYNTHRSSGLGQASCASCHVDARADRLGWDLGNPAGSLDRRNGVTYHPMKGPMRTTSLIGIVGSPLLHFRGDRDNVREFAGTFHDLQGLAAPMDQASMRDLERFIGTIRTPPNPYRNLDNSLPSRVRIPGPFGRAGDPRNTSNNCFQCHSQASNGRDGVVRPRPGNTAGPQPAIAPSLKSMHEILGLYYNSRSGSNAGFGYIHDGAFDEQTQGTLQNDNNLAFMLTFNGESDTDTPAAVGVQVALAAPIDNAAEQRLGRLLALANRFQISLAAHGQLNGRRASFSFLGSDQYLGDDGRVHTHAQLRARAAQGGNRLVFTAVPVNGSIAAGVDPDRDGELGSEDAPTLGQVRAVAVNNPGFEAQRLARDGQFVLGNVSGWQLDSRRAGVWNATPGNYTHQAPQGNNVLFIDSGGSVSQRLSEVLRADTSLMLRAKVGDERSRSGDSSGWAMRLYAGSTLLGSVSNADFNPDHDRFIDATLTLSREQLAGFSAAFGQPLRIELFDSGAAANVHFDDIRLYVKSVGEDVGGNTNTAPSITTPADQIGRVGDDISLRVAAADSDGDALTYSASGLPEGLRIDAGSGLIQGSLRRVQNTRVTVSVSDGSASSAVNFDWRVDAADTADRPIGDGQALDEQLATGTWHFYTIDTDAAHTRLTVELSQLSADLDLYVRAGERPSGHVDDGGRYDCGSYAGGTSSERCRLDNRGATRWHIGVFAYRGGQYRLRASLSGGGNQSITPLALGTSVNDDADGGQWHYYRVQLPADAASLEVRLDQLRADVDLYVREGQTPSGTVDQGGEYDCGSYRGGRAEELCTLDAVAGKTYIIGVYGYEASSYRLIANQRSASVEAQELANGRSVNASVGEKAWRYYRIRAGADVTRARFELAGMGADGDLYIRADRPPSGPAESGANAICRSTAGSTTAERCVVANSGATDWYVGVYGYQATDFTLLATLESGARSSRVSKPAPLAKDETIDKTTPSTDESADSPSGGGGALGVWALLLGLGGLATRLPRRSAREVIR